MTEELERERGIVIVSDNSQQITSALKDTLKRKMKVVVVVGSCQGIGAALRKELEGNSDIIVEGSKNPFVVDHFSLNNLKTPLDDVTDEVLLLSGLNKRSKKEMREVSLKKMGIPNGQTFIPKVNRKTKRW